MGPFPSPGDLPNLGILPTRDWTQVCPHCRQILYQLSHQRSPGILEWVAYPFSSRSSRPRNRTRVSCIAGGFFTDWATREAPYVYFTTLKKKGSSQQYHVYKVWASEIQGDHPRFPTYVLKWYVSDWKTVFHWQWALNRSLNHVSVLSPKASRGSFKHTGHNPCSCVWPWSLLSAAFGRRAGDGFGFI